MATEQFFNAKEIKKFLATRAKEEQKARAGMKETADRDLQQPVVGYRMLEKMGSGGMAVVFKAENIETGQIVALKLLYPNTPENILQQFINEGMILMKLDHPNILKGFDFGFSNGFYFIASECIQGESLVTFLDKGFQFTEDFTFEMALQVARGLAYLEQQNIVHRDIKPSNILLADNAVKLCDFALALDVGNSPKGEEETTCGTVEYISPEQARGKKNIDSRSDVYSLGITCIQMITGELPFEGDNPMEIMRQQIYEPIDLNSYKKISSTASLLLSLMVAKKRHERLLASKLVPLLEKFTIK